jgi:hypothetical protein
MDAPDPTCPRCSKPIVPGTASQWAGHPIHMRCGARATHLQVLESRESAAAARARVVEARSRPTALAQVARLIRACSICSRPLATGGGLLFQGDMLVHAACWTPGLEA